MTTTPPPPPPDPSLGVGVDSIHINVGQGDCAIHLLVDIKTTPAKPTIQRATLIDGGKGAGYARIKDSIDAITKRYTLPTGATTLQFDSVVITHWDLDHYKGVLDLINLDLTDQFKAITPQPPTQAKLDAIRCRYFKYGTPTGRGTPQTTFYAPYWDGSALSFSATRKRKHPNDRPTVLTSSGTKPDLLLDFAMYVHSDRSKMKPEPDKTDGKKPFAGVCNLRYEPAEMVGVNFFDNVKLTAISWDVVKDVSELVDNISWPAGTLVGVFCVGTYNATIGDKAPTFTVMAVDEKNEPKNWPSVAAIVLWKSSKRVSHYFAGDAWYVTEKRLAKWINSEVTSMKLSHHGSWTSTPIEMLNTFKPKRMVISAGNEYWHPSWGTLMYLNAWLFSQPALRPILATRYPYYCRTTDGQFPNTPGFGDVHLFIEGTDPTKKERVEFFKALSQLYTDLNTKNPTLQQIKDLREQAKDWYKTASTGLPPKTQKYNNVSWMAQQIEYAWNDSLSPMYHKGPTPTTDRRLVETDDIVIKSRFDTTLDGGIEVHFPSSVVEKYTTPVIKVALSTAHATAATGTPPIPALLYDNIDSSLLASKTNPPPIKFVGGHDDDSGDGGDGGDDSGDEPSPTSGLMVHIAADTASDGYWFASSSVVPSEPNEESIRILEVGPMDSFVTTLHNIMFGVETEPEPNTTTQFFAEDEWYSWLKDSVSATSFHMTSDETGNPAGFALELNWPGDEFEGTQTPLRFDTDFVQEAFGMAAEVTPAIGLLGNTNVMVLGLDSAQNVLISSDLMAVLKYAGLEELSDSLLIRILGASVALSLSSNHISSNGARNAVWFEPGAAYRTTMRLQWNFVDLATIQGFFDFIKSGITFKNARVITRRTSSWLMSPEGGFKVVTNGEATVEVKFDVSSHDLQFIGSLTFGIGTTTVVLTTINNVGEKLVDWLAEEVGSDIPFVSWINGALDTLFEKFSVRRVTLLVDEQNKITNWSLDVEISLLVAGGATVLLTYSSERTRLRGQLWFRPPNAFPPLLLPTWEESQELLPLTAAAQEYLDLKNLTPGGITNIPKQIPSEVRAARIQIDADEISFYGLITAEEPTPGESIPPVRLDMVELSSRYTFGGQRKGNLQLVLNFAVVLTAPIATDGNEDEEDEESEIEDTTTLGGVIEYNDGEWTLTASMTPLSFATIYEFFDPEAQEEVLSVLGRIQLLNLNLLYHYENGVGSSFALDGVLLLGDLELSVTYRYTPEGWTIDAILGAAEDAATLGDIVEGISGEKDLLPDFIANIGVAGVADGGAVRISCTRVGKKTGSATRALKEAKEDSYIFFTASVKVNIIQDVTVQATFLQYRDLSWPTTAPAKRVLKASVIGLPPVEIPVVGDLTQPFDEMFYMWVLDGQPQASTKRLPGLSDKEVQYINSGLDPDENKPPIDELIFRDQRKVKNDTDVVIPAGSHFVLVIVNHQQIRSVIVNYSFSAKKREQLLGSERALVLALADESSGTGTGDSSMAPYKRDVGPVSISNIGFRYKDNILSIVLDAAFLLGPIGFTFLGFSIDINLKGITIQEITLANVSPALSGLAVMFDRPPIRLAGLFSYVNNDQIKYFAGGIIIAFNPYLFTAAGFYGQVKTPPFETCFVFAKLEGPLVTLEFAEISGITGGFGYNSDVKFPAVNQIQEFPFVGGTGLSDDLMTTLANLVSPSGSGWFSPRDGSLWLAAGLKVTAFQTLSIDAVVVVSWNPYVKLGIFGVAIADIPKGVPTKFAHVELGIMATVDFGAGVMKFEAQLSPNSYIFAPSCHLTGGFALYYWFAGSEAPQPLEGDWVFTIGGFHRAFNVPTHYPNPPRLGISWTVDSSISITGEAYFAITPKCCMGGGRLKATLALGPLRAWFEAWADFLINYKPFHFMAEGGVTIGVSCKVDLFICSFTISIEIGARLYLEGPPLAGRVHVDFWVCSFDINFGPKAQRPAAVTLSEFYRLVLQSANSQQDSLAGFLMAAPSKKKEISIEEEAASDTNAHVFSCRAGLLEGDGSSTETPEGADWKVRGGSFVFATSCRFAINRATVLPADEFRVASDEDLPETSWDTDIYAKPMQLTTGLTSELVVGIKRTPSKAMGAQMEEEEVRELQEEQWQIKPILKAVPMALWGKYNPSEDPVQSGNSVKNLLNGSSSAVTLLMGAEITAPKPTLSKDLIGKFDTVAASALAVFPQSQEPEFPKFAPGSTKWAPEAVQDGVDQWDKAKQVWTNPNAGEGAAQETVDLLAAAMGWTEGPRLSAKVPKRLVSALGRMYMAAPRISVA